MTIMAGGSTNQLADVSSPTLKSGVAPPWLVIGEKRVGSLHDIRRPPESLAQDVQILGDAKTCMMEFGCTSKVLVVSS